jgi:hypothetical protein
VRIKIGARAGAQVERERRWWRANRDYPDLFDQEYEQTLHQLQVMPQVGTPCPTEKRPHLLRVLLPKTANHIYYTIERKQTLIVVHSFWGARRRHPPKL